MPKENASCECLSLIVIDSDVKVNKMNYPQTLLEECKYWVIRNEMGNLISDDSEFDNESDSGFDNEFDNESDRDESSS